MPAVGRPWAWPLGGVKRRWFSICCRRVQSRRRARCNTRAPGATRMSRKCSSTRGRKSRSRKVALSTWLRDGRTPELTATTPEAAHRAWLHDVREWRRRSGTSSTSRTRRGEVRYIHARLTSGRDHGAILAERPGRLIRNDPRSAKLVLRHNEAHRRLPDGYFYAQHHRSASG